MPASTARPAALLDCPAPAKLNLFLHVTGRRTDGYHTLQTVFQLIDLADRLDFEVRTDGAVVRRTELDGVAAATDLSVRAALLLQAEARARGLPAPGVTIDITKHIPMGGGLGGGSSDAATTLLALNRLWGLPNVMLTPHVAVRDAENVIERRYQILVDNAKRFEAGKPLHNLVDKAAWF